jgi:hypothetical protein
MRIQAAYNNASEIELAGDVPETQTSNTLLYPIGTKIAKQFDGADGELVWFEGVVQRYDEEDDLYWILYSDGDSEDVHESEVQAAVLDHRMHMSQPAQAELEKDISTVGAATDEATVPVTTDEAVLAAAVLVANSNSVQSSSTLDASEIAVAMRAMTAAAER